MNKKLFLILVTIAVLSNESLATIVSSSIHSSKNWRVCFTPPHGHCSKIIVHEIQQAKMSVYVMAYGFTSSSIAQALIDASARGVQVHILLDKSNLTDKRSKMQAAKDAKIDVGIYKVAAISHNKIIIIDGHKVITGSFNFTASADLRNAENVLVIDDEELAQKYLMNFNGFKKT